jgi:hypothetical protein
VLEGAPVTRPVSVSITTPTGNPTAVYVSVSPSRSMLANDSETAAPFRVERFPAALGLGGWFTLVMFQVKL